MYADREMVCPSSRPFALPARGFPEKNYDSSLAPAEAGGTACSWSLASMLMKEESHYFQTFSMLMEDFSMLMKDFLMLMKDFSMMMHDRYMGHFLPLRNQKMRFFKVRNFR